MNDFVKKEEQLISEYEKIKPQLIRWGEFIDCKLLELLTQNGYEIDRIQIKPKFRLKTDNSVIGRAFYRDVASSEPLKRIEDKVATRIVVTTLNDVKEIEKIISEHHLYWDSRISRGLEKHLAKPKEFDYNSLHLNLMPTENVDFFGRNYSKEQRKLYICELQVRTLLQHAFAEVAHDTIYKGPYGADSQLVRIMSRGVALMEATDEYFCKAYDIMESENTYEKSFLGKLIELSSRLNLNKQFSNRGTDNPLTNMLFSLFEIKKIDIQDIERVVIANKITVEKAINNSNSYLSQQPVIILVLYQIYLNRYSIKEKWELDEDILTDLFYRLGYSYGK